jgi:REP element-mobilizing transposase RayT
MAKRIRLPLSAYSVPGDAWLVTIGTLDRERKPLANPALASAIRDCFVADTPERGAKLHLAVILPEHAHLIVEITDGDLVALMRDLKTRTTRLWWQHEGQGTLWQKSFHDRGLRGPKAFDDAVAYVLGNPMRAGLVDAGEDYPFLGGLLLADEI